ncbi:hypothetical protein K432DRAFT_424924, partial [Lepidopterella palustris CBS 459.81]
MFFNQLDQMIVKDDIDNASKLSLKKAICTISKTSGMVMLASFVQLSRSCFGVIKSQDSRMFTMSSIGKLKIGKGIFALANGYSEARDDEYVMAKWPAPNYVNPETRVPLLVGFMVSTTAIMLFFLAGSLFVRSVIQAGFGIGDWFMVTAAVFACANATLGLVSCKYGSGYHVWDFKPEWAIPYGKLGLVSEIVWAPTVTLPKISLLFTY